MEELDEVFRADLARLQASLEEDLLQIGLGMGDGLTIECQPLTLQRQLELATHPANHPANQPTS